MHEHQPQVLFSLRAASSLAPAPHWHVLHGSPPFPGRGLGDNGIHSSPKLCRVHCGFGDIWKNLNTAKAFEWSDCQSLCPLNWGSASLTAWMGGAFVVNNVTMSKSLFKIVYLHGLCLLWIVNMIFRRHFIRLQTTNPAVSQHSKQTDF